MSGRRFTGPTENVPRINYVPFVRRGGAVPVPAPREPGDGSRVGAVPRGPAALSELKTILADSPRGAAAVKYIEVHRLPVVFTQRGGSKWDGHTITIDLSGRSKASAALSLVHEARHARTTMEGHGANVKTNTRTVYVDKMLEDEVRARVDATVARNEIVANGKLSPSTYEAKYNDAFRSGMAALQQSNPSASITEWAAAGEKAGYDVLMKEYRDGSAKTSTPPHGSSPDHFGRIWDERHPPAPQAKR
jgi:hypothetical protein